jgi:hypothetical protein
VGRLLLGRQKSVVTGMRADDKRCFTTRKISSLPSLAWDRVACHTHTPPQPADPASPRLSSAISRLGHRLWTQEASDNMAEVSPLCCLYLICANRDVILIAIEWKLREGKEAVHT